MVAAHYPLQALLYTVALHRYLRWRLPGYDPDAHLGGVLYLFVRGMSAEEPPPSTDAALRRLVLAPAGRAGRGAERPLRPGRAGVTIVEAVDAFDARLALGAVGTAARLQPAPASSRPRTSTSRCAWPG